MGIAIEAGATTRMGRANAAQALAGQALEPPHLRAPLPRHDGLVPLALMQGCCFPEVFPVKWRLTSTLLNLSLSPRTVLPFPCGVFLERPLARALWSDQPSTVFGTLARQCPGQWASSGKGRQ